MYYVIHSVDPYLLARFCTELQMARCCEITALKMHPFVGEDGVATFLQVLGTGVRHLQFMRHNGCGFPTRFILTSRNYTKVLEAVLTNRTASDAEKGGEG